MRWTVITKKRSDLILSGRARDAFDLTQEQTKCATNMAVILSGRVACWRAA